ncbi:MAG: aminopeptidase P N-terminal domain-containing protein [Acholeplasmatales bacterium]|nr:aminopeptidase P N-terminal domain-containing protein [Acholeplasmatales bacterium]
MTKEEYIRHRNRIAKKMIDNSILVSFAPREGEDFYQPDRNFLYATGIKESRDRLVIIKRNGKMFDYLFIQEYDPVAEKWVGRTLNCDEASDISGINAIYYLKDFDSFLHNQITLSPNLYLDLERGEDSDSLSYTEQFAKNIKDKYPYVNILQGRSLFSYARTIKSKEEIDEIRKAIHITRLGIEELMKNVKPGLYEYQLESYFDQTIKFNGANGFSFSTIAASGANSCCLHYSSNKDIIRDNDIMLFDLGATNNYYCADISRTIPVNGKFSPRQKEIYNIVLKGQALMFNTIKPGITQRELNKILRQYYCVELKKIGLIKEDAELDKYYFHGVSHHLGLDCHDLCDYGPLEAGAVISNEPGLYIPEEKIGIRIEDDVLVTEDGCENLSEEIIKSVDEIEVFMKKYNPNLK